MLISSQFEEISRVREWLGGHASAAGFSDQEVRGLKLAVSEACANVIEHAYKGEPGNPIELHLVVNEESLVLTIRDFGAKFDLEKYELPDLSEPHEGGYGVFLIRSLIDKVEYDTSNERGTMLTLTKYRLLPSPQAPQ